MNTIIEKIRAEIKIRLSANGAFDEEGDSAWHYDQGLNDAYNYILSVLSDLEKEERPNDQWSEEDNVMVKDIINAIDKNYASSDWHEMVDWLKSLHLKVKSEKPMNPVLQDFPTTEKEMQDFLATHERIPVPERLNSLERILQEQPVCEGLEEEISDYIDKHFHIRNDETLENGNDPLDTYDFYDAARHFAQWCAEHVKREGEE